MAFLGDDKSMVYELILALVSLWLLVNSIKKEKSQRKTSDWFFLVYFTKRYFFIILPLFDFQRGYGMTERSDFILTEINGCKWNENKNETKIKNTQNKWGPLRVHRMNWQLKNDEERMKKVEEQLKIFAKSPTETLRKCLGLDFLHGNNFFH